MSSTFTLKFWGVRGSLPVPGPDTVRYGGNTTCIELMLGPRRLIIDCGSGAYPLGRKLAAKGELEADLLFTHSHLDHVCGLPFFKPAYMHDAVIRCWAGHLGDTLGLDDVISWLMAPALFPVPMTELKGCRLNTFKPGDELDLGGGLLVQTCELNHPGGAVGYRIEHDGRSLVIAFDHEHGDERIDDGLLAFAKGADVMIYDATYTDDEYKTYRGWGHSTWSEGVRLAEKAGVGQTYMFHHAQDRTDDELDDIRRRIRAKSKACDVAIEGESLTICT
ncbi:MAG: MBL fold metallo-hydrolase, partial [Pseudomonadota bacterium]